MKKTFSKEEEEGTPSSPSLSSSSLSYSFSSDGGGKGPRVTSSPLTSSSITSPLFLSGLQKEQEMELPLEEEDQQQHPKHKHKHKKDRPLSFSPASPGAPLLSFITQQREREKEGGVGENNPPLSARRAEERIKERKKREMKGKEGSSPLAFDGEEEGGVGMGGVVIKRDKKKSPFFSTSGGSPLYVPSSPKKPSPRKKRGVEGESENEKLREENEKLLRQVFILFLFFSFCYFIALFYFTRSNPMIFSTSPLSAPSHAKLRRNSKI